MFATLTVANKICIEFSSVVVSQLKMWQTTKGYFVYIWATMSGIAFLGIH